MSSTKSFVSAFNKALDCVYVNRPQLVMQYKRKPIVVGYADKRLARLVSERYDKDRPNARMIGRTWDDISKGNTDPDIRSGLNGIVYDGDTTLILNRDSNGPFIDRGEELDQVDGFDFLGLPVVNGIGVCVVWDLDMHPKERANEVFDVKEFRKIFPYVNYSMSAIDKGYRSNIYLRALSVYPEQTPVFALNKLFGLDDKEA